MFEYLAVHHISNEGLQGVLVAVLRSASRSPMIINKPKYDVEQEANDMGHYAIVGYDITDTDQNPSKQFLRGQTPRESYHVQMLLLQDSTL